MISIEGGYMKDNFVVCDCNVIHESVVKRVMEDMPSDESLESLSLLFKIIGDNTRTKIIWLLDHEEMCVCDIANVLGMTKSRVSHQLAILKNAGIVKFKKVGKEVNYSLDDEHITKLFETGIEHIRHRLDRDYNAKI